MVRLGRNGIRVSVSHDGALRALSVSDEGELWRREFDFTTTAVTRPRSGASTTLYVGDYDGRLLALSPREGETRWVVGVDADEFYPTVQRTSSTVYVGGAGVHAVDPVSGERRWSFGTDTGPGSHVTAHASTTVFALERGENKRERTLSALDPDTGERRREFTPRRRGHGDGRRRIRRLPRGRIDRLRAGRLGRRVTGRSASPRTIQSVDWSTSGRGPDGYRVRSEPATVPQDD
jgi:outer membrane protein assembly factor BamB